jgi:hypothetical protein
MHPCRLNPRRTFVYRSEQYAAIGGTPAVMLGHDRPHMSSSRRRAYGDFSCAVQLKAAAWDASPELRSHRNVMPQRNNAASASHRSFNVRSFSEMISEMRSPFACAWALSSSPARYRLVRISSMMSTISGRERGSARTSSRKCSIEAFIVGLSDFYVPQAALKQKLHYRVMTCRCRLEPLVSPIAAPSDAYVGKPYSPRALLAKIREYAP